MALKQEALGNQRLEQRAGDSPKLRWVPSALSASDPDLLKGEAEREKIKRNQGLRATLKVWLRRKENRHC